METNHPVIIKKVRKGGHGGHHGGAWKVAYADFVTAMMAFFLLMWLLNATTDAQKSGIADYFAPASIARTNSGAGSILGGTSASSPASKSSDVTTGGVLLAIPAATPSTQLGEGYRDAEFKPSEREEDDEELEMSRRQLEKLMAQQEEQAFEKAEQDLREALEADPELKQMADNLLVDRTPEGLRIQIIDDQGLSMFPLGSPRMMGHMQDILRQVAKAVERLPNKISVSGHTDAVPYANDSGYSNWELSSDRANASRRALIEGGLPADRVVRVVGKAETDPLLANDPKNPRNRRISIILMRENQPQAALGAMLERTFSPAAGPLPQP